MIILRVVVSFLVIVMMFIMWWFWRTSEKSRASDIGFGSFITIMALAFVLMWV